MKNASATLALLLLAGCKGGTVVAPAVSDTGTAAYGDTIVDSSIGDAIVLNPVLLSDASSGDIVGRVFNGLIKYDGEMRLVGDLAETWTVSPDGLVITFRLRRGVRWHDGQPFTADDVRFTYQKLVDPAVKTPYSSDFDKVKSVEVLDPLTVRITYKEPFSPGLASWSMGMVPRHVFAGADFNKHPANRKPIGTGPFKFVEWQTGQKVVLAANTDYFDGRPYLDRLIYRIIPDQAVQFMELRKQAIDWMGLTPDQYARESAAPDLAGVIEKYRYPAFSYSYLGYNLKNPLFNDLRVRRAIAYAINKQAIINGVLLGLGVSCTGPFPPKSWAYNPDARDYPYDPEKAKALLAEAGWRDTKGGGVLEKAGRTFTFTLMTNQGNKTRELCAQIIQQQLKKVGIAVDLRVIEWRSFIEQFVKPRKFEAIIIGWALGPEPDCFSMWHSSQQGPDQYNFVGYSNPEVDRLLVAGRREFDHAKRKAIYNKIHAILAEEQPYTFLYVPDALPALHKRFRGIVPAPMGIGYNFERWYVPKTIQKYLSPA